MQGVSPRQQQILGLARQAGSVTVDDLALRFDVTPQTIRKDLNELCDARLLVRTHGGAMLASGVENLAYEARRQMAATEKGVIGRHAASLIPNNCSLFINIGTTTEEVARALVHHEGLLVITNNIHVASILMANPGIDVILAGGKLRKSDGGIVGEAAVDFITQFKVDHAVIGASAIDDDGAMLDLVADGTKFTRTAPVRIGHLSDVDVFVTDHMPPEPVVAYCGDKGVRLEIADGLPGNDNAMDAAE